MYKGLGCYYRCCFRNIGVRYVNGKGYVIWLVVIILVFVNNYLVEGLVLRNLLVKCVF